MITLYKNKLIELANKLDKEDVAVETAKNGVNHLCGDTISLLETYKKGTIDTLRINANGCTLHLASSALLKNISYRKSIRELTEIFDKFQKYAKGEANKCPIEFMIFKAINEYPARHRCVFLSWQTLLNGNNTKNS